MRRVCLIVLAGGVSLLAFVVPGIVPADPAATGKTAQTPPKPAADANWSQPTTATASCAHQLEKRSDQRHQPAAVGCEKCHGMSVKHSPTRTLTRPPDVRQNDVNAFA